MIIWYNEFSHRITKYWMNIGYSPKRNKNTEQTALQHPVSKNCQKNIKREKKEDRDEWTIRKDGIEEVEQMERFLFYRQSEVDRYQISFD